jgi:uncharacterized protein
MITRTIFNYISDKIKSENKKAIIIYGARQVGKTTLVKQIKEQYKGKSEYYNCDFLDVQDIFSYSKAHLLIEKTKHLDLLILDEAQRIENIGLVLKILIDNLPDVQIIATGSSSFELSNKINEPLTGRKIVFKLFPFSFQELYSNKNFIEQQRTISKHMIYGSYPQVALSNENDSIEILKEITNSYLFKDIFTFQQLRKPELLTKLLRLLAFQIGSQVSYTELAKTLQVDQTVVQRYLHLLEEAFVIFRLTSYKKNLRNEIARSNKFYFWDIGIRNALIQNFNSFDLRDDVGHLWENYLIAERLKFIKNNNITLNSFFWRTYEQKEIDLIEERDGKLAAYEMKWNNLKKSNIPKIFSEAYPNTEFKSISQDNFTDFLLNA